MPIKTSDSLVSAATLAEYAKHTDVATAVTGLNSALTTNINSVSSSVSNLATTVASTYAPIANPNFSGTVSIGGVQKIRDNLLQTYITAGSGTWSKPAGAKRVRFIICGGGGGGASGAKGTGGALSGGSPGGASAAQEFVIEATEVSDTCAYIIGAGGAGGAAIVTNSTNGLGGSSGGQTSIQINPTTQIRTASCGGGGVGSWGGTFNTGASTTTFSTTVGAFKNISTTSTATVTLSASLTANIGTRYYGGAILLGLPGGSISSAGVALTPGVIISPHYAGGTITMPNGSIAGENGVGVRIGNSYYAFGGNGGSASITAGVAAQAGGNGIYGSSGGGGGAALDSAGASGAGGRGGDGWMIIITEF